MLVMVSFILGRCFLLVLSTLMARQFYSLHVSDVYTKNVVYFVLARFVLQAFHVFLAHSS